MIMTIKNNTPDQQAAACIKGILTALLLFAFTAPACFAHSLFIQSSRYKVNEGKASPMFFCYGHHIPVDDGVRSKKLKSIKVYSPKGDVREIGIRDETCLHSYMINYDTPGTWMLTAETNPGYYTVYTDKKGRERHTIKPMNKIRDKAAKIHISLYSKQYTKTYVVCDTPSATSPQKAGLALELIPANDIFSLKPGENLELNVYQNGKLFTGQGTWDATYNGFSTIAENMFHPKTQVNGSRITIPIPNPGRWFIRYFVKVPAPEEERQTYKQMKLTATLVFQVDNERKKL